MATIQPDPCAGTTPRTETTRRAVYLALGAGLTAFALIEMIRFGGTTWFALLFAILPDVALIYGAAPGWRPADCTRGRSGSTTSCTASSSPSP